MKYTKMHGAGNGFVLLDNSGLSLTEEDCRKIAVMLCAKEHTDGLMALLPCEDADFAMLYLNSDGSLGEMCGNGARCIARFGYEHGFSRDPEHIRFRATAGIITGRRITEEMYEVRLNDPSVIDLHRQVPCLGDVWDCSYIELGDPGIPVVTVEIPEERFACRDELFALGRKLRYSPCFPRGANITFACVTGEYSARALTYERGVEDFTLACGTGSSAAAATLILQGKIAGDHAEITVPGGQLSVRLTVEKDWVKDIFLTGPTAVVSESGLSLHSKLSSDCFE